MAELLGEGAVKAKEQIISVARKELFEGNFAIRTWQTIECMLRRAYNTGYQYGYEESVKGIRQKAVDLAKEEPDNIFEDDKAFDDYLKYIRTSIVELADEIDDCEAKHADMRLTAERAVLLLVMLHMRSEEMLRDALKYKAEVKKLHEARIERLTKLP